jgi:phosphatidylethanolamine/phosphatidyl-N-methylethanolamine N-methyltransferase
METTQSLPFLREVVRDFRTTGAVAPSSRRLAARLCAPVARAARPVSVLEVGAGTGVVTRALAGLLGADDRLDVVEVNPRFVGVLRADPTLSDAAARIRLLPGCVTEVALGHRYDMVVSGLPFTNFAPGEVRTILRRYVEVLAPGGCLTYFGYLGTRWARAVTGTPAERARHRAVEAVLADADRRYGVRHSIVWSNLPPARVRELRVPR